MVGTGRAEEVLPILRPPRAAVLLLTGPLEKGNLL